MYLEKLGIVFCSLLVIIDKKGARSALRKSMMFYGTRLFDGTRRTGTYPP